jgi:hypothetical protein
MIDNRLNPFRCRIRHRPYESLTVLIVKILHHCQIIQSRVFFQRIESELSTGFEKMNSFKIGFHEADHDVALLSNDALAGTDAMHRIGHTELTEIENERKTLSQLFDFTLGTHPISTKGTTELGRSEATKRFW